jgi:hydroxyacylglutathione hydrolase
MWQLQSFTFSPFAENTYLLWNENKDTVIIDPGCYESYEKAKLQDFIQQNGLLPKLLLNTHCHLDHVFGEKWVAETYKLIPHIHFNEQFMMERAEMAGELWGVPFTNYKGPFEYLEEGQVITLGKDKIKVLYVPGHSPGHVCFYCSEQNFVIAGDTLFAGSIGRTDLPGGDHATLIEYIKSQLLTLPGATAVYSGHGPSTIIEEEKRSNPYLQ